MLKSSNDNYVVNGRHAPCKDCKNRVPMCHSKCSTYILYQDAKHNRDKTIAKNKGHYLTMTRHQVERVRATKRRD